MRHLIRLTVLALTSFGFSTSLIAGTVEAKKDDVEIYATADKGSAVVAKLKKGDTVSSGERSGMYWNVKLPVARLVSSRSWL